MQSHKTYKVKTLKAALIEKFSRTNQTIGLILLWQITYQKSITSKSLIFIKSSLKQSADFPKAIKYNVLSSNNKFILPRFFKMAVSNLALRHYHLKLLRPQPVLT